MNPARLPSTVSQTSAKKPHGFRESYIEFVDHDGTERESASVVFIWHEHRSPMTYGLEVLDDFGNVLYSQDFRDDYETAHVVTLERSDIQHTPWLYVRVNGFVSTARRVPSSLFDPSASFDDPDPDMGDGFEWFGDPDDDPSRGTGTVTSEQLERFDARVTERFNAIERSLGGHGRSIRSLESRLDDVQEDTADRLMDLDKTIAEYQRFVINIVNVMADDEWGDDHE